MPEPIPALDGPHAREPSSLKGDPFRTRIEVPVAGGALTVALAGPPPEPGRPVVLALHSMSTTHVAYRSIVRELGRIAPEISVIAPDLRGRGRSAKLPRPFGIAQHIVDLVAVLDHVGAERAILAGWSMGCSFAARFALEYPERIAAIVLFDGGLPMVADNEMPEPGPDEEEPPSLFDRFELNCATVDEYLEYWRNHPSLARFWDEDIEAFVNSDYVRDENGVRCIANLDALMTDVQDLMFDRRTLNSVSEASVPVRVMRAERGMYDDDPLMPEGELDQFLRENPHVDVETIPDVNHFTIVLGGGDAPRRVAATLAELTAQTSRP
jgi:pimeloyl-ACP methyl ester carboxylesterase